MGFTEVERSIITEENIMLYWKMTDVLFNLIIQIFRFIWLVRDLPLIIVLNSFTRKMFGLRLKALIVFPCVSVLPRLWFSFRLRRPVVFAALTAVRLKTTESKPSKLCEWSLSQANPKFQCINNAHDCTTCKLVHESILDWDHLRLLKPGMTAVIELSILRRHWNGNSLLKTGLVDNLVKLNNVKLAAVSSAATKSWF